MNLFDRRDFLISLSTVVAGLGFADGETGNPASEGELLGQGKYRWRVVPGWGVLDAETPVADCHGMLQTKDGRIFLLTNHIKNNVIIYDRGGKLLGKWGTGFPGAHGFTLSEEKGEEFFYITDSKTGKFFKTTLDGKILRTWEFPEASGKYTDAGQFKPTHVALAPDGGFFVVDGYGQNWCHRYDAAGRYMNSFGGNAQDDSGLKCAHGAWVDTREPETPIWITSRSESKLKRYTLDGELLEIIDLPGGHPNFIVPFGDHTFIPHLRGNVQKKGAQQNGFLSILGPDRKLVANLGAPPPDYSDGSLKPLGADTPLFTYPHGILIDDEKSVYVAQWNSMQTYPIKLERVEA